METTTPRRSWKQKLRHEISDYGINLVYLGLFLSSIVFYRRQVLAEYNIELDDYLLGFIKAAIIAKVVMIAGFFRFMKWLDHKPLLYPVLFKSITLVSWVMLFDLLEESVRGVIHQVSLAELPALWVERMSPVWFASAILIFFCFIPYFAFKEMARVMGKQRIKSIFLGERSRAEEKPPVGHTPRAETGSSRPGARSDASPGDGDSQSKRRNA